MVKSVARELPILMSVAQKRFLGWNPTAVMILCRILLGDGHILRWSDLTIGTAINLYNRVFYIYACDPFTRDFLKQQGLPQPPNQSAPSDPYHNRMVEKENLIQEVKTRVMAYEKLPDAAKYLENARRVRHHEPCKLPSNI